MSHLASAQGEGEGLTPVSGAVHLGPVGQSKHVVTLNLLPGPGEAGTIPSLKSLDVNTHVFSEQPNKCDAVWSEIAELKPGTAMRTAHYFWGIWRSYLKSSKYHILDHLTI